MKAPPVRWSLLTNEDWVSVWLGFLLIALVIAGVRLPLPAVKWATWNELPGTVFSATNIWAVVQLGLASLVLASVGIALMGGSVVRYLRGFPLVFALAWVSQALAGNATFHRWGLEYVIFALLIGLLLGNTLRIPAWLKEAVRTEYYIKVGLVIFGASILFHDILQAGALGIIQALLVVTAVWYVGFWIARRLKVDDEFAVMLATAVSICGVSAAIAACGAIQGDKKKLSYVTSLVLVCAVPMMIAMPWLAKAMRLSDPVAGAWIGGVIDTSGAVVAAGALVSEAAMKASVIVKFSQNVLIGVAAFFLSLWWALRSGSRTGKPPSPRMIWERFPKFILGFVVVSLAFSFCLDSATVSATKSVLKGFQTVWFALAFVCIGLETRFTELLTMQEGRPALAFLVAQAFNILWTFILAFLLFSGAPLAVPTLN